MTTLHFTNAYHPASGGIRTFYHALLDAAPQHRRQVRLVVPGDADRVEDVNAFARIYVVRARPSPVVDRRYRLILPYRFAWPGAGRLWQILDRERPDLIEICDKYCLPYFAGLIRKLRARRPALVGLTCERMDDNVRAFVSDSPMAARLTASYIRTVYIPQLDAHIANSTYTAAELAHNPRHPRPVYIRHMGVDTITFTPARRSRTRREWRRRQLGMPVGAPLLLYAGRLSAEKHAGLLIDMMRELRWTGTHLVVAGGGPLDGVLRARAAAECPGIVHFVDMIADREALADLFADADLFVHPNPREPFGIAPLEAMAAGLPLVAPNRGGVTSYANQTNAWIAAADGESLAKAVVDALVNVPEREGRRQRALSTAAAHAWPVAAAAFFALYDHIALRRSRETESAVSLHSDRAGVSRGSPSLSR